MSRARDDQEGAQSIVEKLNDQANRQAMNQKARPLPDRNAWTRSQLERSNKEFDRMKKQEESR
jgi:hypothetical protein